MLRGIPALVCVLMAEWAPVTLANTQCYPVTRRDVDRELAGEVVNLTLVHVSDKRSRLVAVNKYMTMCEWDYYVSSPHKCYGGADRWIGYINKVHNETRSSPDQVLFTVEATQAFQGTAFYWFERGKSDVEVMNAGDHPLDVFAVSNSELGDGLEHMLVWMEWLDPSTDVVLSNVNWTGSVLEGSRLKRWAVRERRGLQVGFVAYLREDIHVVVAGLNPETFVVNPLGLGTAVELNKAVMEMMACHPGVAAVVLLGRSRQFEFESYLKTMDRVTVGVNGESFTSLVNTDEVKLPHEVPSVYDNQDARVYSQTTKYGTGVAHVWAAVNTTTKRKVAWGGRHMLLTDDVAPSHPATFKMLEELSTTVSRMLDSKLVGNISSDVYGGEGVPHDNSTWPGCRAHDCPMGRAVNDAMLASCRLQLGESPCDFAINNGGVIRDSFVYDPRTGGAVTMRDVVEVLPYQNHMVVLRIQGMHITTMLQRMIWRMIEVQADSGGWPGSFAQVSDLRYVYNPLAESEKDTIVLVQVLKDGEWGPLRPNAFYRVATSNYLADGGDGYTEFRDFGLDNLNGQNQESILVSYIELSRPGYFQSVPRDLLASCIGLNRYVVAGGDGDLHAWPQEASHCNIIQAQRTVLLVCGAGEYHRMEGALQECLPCPIGTASAEGDNSYADNQTCAPCPAGTFSGKLGSLECIPCDSVQHLKGAYFQAREGQGSCEACPAGTSRRLGTHGTSVHECLCRGNFFQPQGLASGAECVPCVVGGVCEGVSDVTQQNAPPYPKPGFWGHPEFRGRFYECDEDRCEGGLEFSCHSGFDADMASNRMCNRVAKGYAQYGSFLLPCANGYQSLESWVVSLVVVFAVCLSFVLLNGWLCTFVSMDVLFKNVRLLAITSSFKLGWHPRLRGVFVFFRFALFDVDVMQPNCIMPWSFQQSFFLQLVLPVVLGLVFFVRPLGYYVRQQSKLRLPWDELDDKKFHQPLNHAVASMCSTILTCYPSLITVLLASLSCEEDASGDAFLVAAPNLKCWSAQHTQLLVCAGVGLPAAILLPVGMAFTLLRNLRRDTLYTESTLQRFGFLYRNYDAEFLYWESVYMGKVLVLVAIQVFLQAAPVLQMFTALMVHLLALTAQAFACPYVSKLVDLQECMMLCLVCVFTASGMLFHAPEVTQTTQDGLSVFLLLLFAAAAAVVARVFVVDATESSSSVMVAATLKKQITAAAQTADPNNAYKSARFARAVRFHSDHMAALARSASCSSRDSNMLGLFKGAAAKVQMSMEAEPEVKPEGMLTTLIRSRKISHLRSQLAQDVGVKELHRTINCKYFLQWVYHRELTVHEADQILYLDDLMAPHVGDQAVTSHFVQSAEASFWRTVLHAFPQLIDFSRTAPQSEIDELRSILEKLALMAHSGAVGHRHKRYADFICDEDLTSVGYWVLHAEAEEREAFLSLVEKVAHANNFVVGVVPAAEDTDESECFRESKSSRSSSVSIVHIESRGVSTSLAHNDRSKA